MVLPSTAALKRIVLLTLRFRLGVSPARPGQRSELRPTGLRGPPRPAKVLQAFGWGACSLYLRPPHDDYVALRGPHPRRSAAFPISPPQTGAEWKHFNSARKRRGGCPPFHHSVSLRDPAVGGQQPEPQARACRCRFRAPEEGDRLDQSIGVLACVRGGPVSVVPPGLPRAFPNKGRPGCDCVFCPRPRGMVSPSEPQAAGKKAGRLAGRGQGDGAPLPPRGSVRGDWWTKRCYDDKEEPEWGVSFGGKGVAAGRPAGHNELTTLIFSPCATLNHSNTRPPPCTPRRPTFPFLESSPVL